MRFLLDEDVNPDVASTARGLGLDVESVHGIGRCGFSDREQLRFAAAQGYVFVTRNRDDFIALTVEFYQAGEPHAGVLIVPRRLPNKNPNSVAGALKRWHDRQPPQSDLPAYSIDFLPSGEPPAG